MTLENFLNPIGLLALAALIPFVIVYLIKPRPLDKPIPSLMFLLKDNKVSNQRSLFRTFMRNLLFFLQLIILAAIAFAIAQPFITLPGQAGSDHTIIVLDSSASMHAGGRFEEALREARAKMQGRVTLIVAEQSPFVLLERGTKGEAEAILPKLKAHDTTSGIGEAIMLASDYYAEGSTVIAISDFADTGGTDPLIAAQTLRARGIPVELVSVGEPQDNIGFVSLSLTKETVRAHLKNYYGDEQPITVSYKSDGKDIGAKNLKIAAGAIEIVDFPTAPGEGTLSFSHPDALASDNTVFLSVPDIKLVRVLLITNIDSEKESGIKTCSQLHDRLLSLRRQKRLNEQFALVRLLDALTQLNRVQCDYTYPPIIPDQQELEGYDLIVLYKFNDREMTPIAYRNLQAAARAGSNIIITGDRLIESQELQDLMPVTTGAKEKTNKTISFERSSITRNVNFESADITRAVSATAKQGAEVIAQADYPLIARWPQGNGSVTFYGLLEDASDFHTLPDYVIFWGQYFEDLTKSVNLDDYNMLTGSFAIVDDDRALLEDAGMSTVGGKRIAANLLNALESDTTNVPDVKGTSTSGGGAGSATQHDVELAGWLAGLGLLFFVIEFLATKLRGEL